MLVGIDLMAKVGVEIMPYLIVREVMPSEPVPAPVGCHGLIVEAADIETLRCRIPGWDPSGARSALQAGDVCAGAIFEGELVAVTWATERSCAARGYDLFDLRPGQWCLYGAATHPGARGLGLAPYVRDLLYRDLDQRRAEQMLSLSYVFNRASVRFKEKLGASTLGRCVWVRLFGGKPRLVLGQEPP